MALVIVKIGENEPETYERFDQLHHHMDIVHILPDGTDLGVNTLKHFLCINVDTSSMDETIYDTWTEQLYEQSIANEHEWRCNKCAYVFSNPILTMPECPKCDSMDTEPIQRKLLQRKRRLDLEVLAFISQDTIGKIEAQATVKRSIKPDVLQYIEDYKNAHEGKDPPSDAVSAYRETLEDNFKMGAINKLEDVESLSEFNAAIRNKDTDTLGLV